MGWGYVGIALLGTMASGGNTKIPLWYELLIVDIWAYIPLYVVGLIGSIILYNKRRYNASLWVVKLPLMSVLLFFLILFVMLFLPL